MQGDEKRDINAKPDDARVRPTLSEEALTAMFAGKRPEVWRTEYAAAFDRGPDLGREVVED